MNNGSIQVYTAEFIDFHGSRLVTFNHLKPLKIPVVSPKYGYVGTWEPFQPSYKNFTVRAIYEPCTIEYVFDGISIKKLLSESPPELNDVPGKVRRWEIPDVSKCTQHIKLTPAESFKTYTIKFHVDDYTIKQVTFNVSSISIKEPYIVQKPGYVRSWSQYNLSDPKNQDSYIESRPIKIILHMLDHTTETYDYSDDFIPPKVDGHKWPKYKIGSEDIDLYPIVDVYFALFYVKSKLYCVVPFTKNDRHYVDELLSNSTVPPHRGRYGEWVLKKSDELCEYYVADYSKSHNADFISTKWSIEKMADCLYEVDSKVVFNETVVDLFDTEFTKITGLSRNNLENQRSLPLKEWLKRENIQYVDKVNGYTVKETSKDGLKIYLNGKFFVEYTDVTEDAIDYLEEFDIIFNSNVIIYPGFKSKKSKYLENSMEINNPDEASVVFQDLYPVDKAIPPFTPVKTPYYDFIEEKTIFTGTEFKKQNIESMKKSNEKIINIFNADYHKELEIKVIDEEKREATVVKYLGSDKEYSVPSLVLKEELDTNGYHIVQISGNAFADNRSLVSISIPSTIRSIEFQAFSDCKNLSEVKLECGLELIGGWSFLDCKKLKKIKIPKTVKKIEEYSFNNLEEIVLESSDTKLDPDAVPKNCVKTFVNHNVCADFLIAYDSEPISDFDKKLSDFEREYIKTILCHKDSNALLEKNHKDASIVEFNINEKYSDVFDTAEYLVDEGIIEDEDAFMLNNFYLNNDKCAKESRDLKMSVFDSKLDVIEREYLKAILHGNNFNKVPTAHEELIELKINEKYAEVYDTVELLIDDGFIEEDVIQKLREIYG